MNNILTRKFSRVPDVGVSPETQSSVYETNYGNMPVPATQFAGSVAQLHSLSKQPSIVTSARNSALVNRVERRNGLHYTKGRHVRDAPLPQYNDPVYSSEYQTWLIGPHVNYILNDAWYIAYPAATISFGTNRNLALSQKVPQIVTRTTGGPGPSAMRPAPKFTAVQQVPRYSTMPSSYNTQSAQG